MDIKKGKKRGAKVVEPSIIRFERITELLDREKLTRKAFAESLGREPGNVSRILKSQKISEDFIDQVISTYPDYRKEWLLGYDEIPTHTEQAAAAERGRTVTAPILVLEAAVKEVCARENIPVPHLDNIPELLLIEAQLKDYAVSLMWNYIKYKDNSFTWSYLNQVEEAANRKRRKERDNG